MAKIFAALASAPGEGAIGIIEVFGPGAAETVDRVFHSPKGRALAESSPNDLLYGRIVDDDRIVDEVIVRIASRDPARLEINCHGGAGPHTAVMGLLRNLGVTECSWRDMISQTALSRGLDTIQVEAAERLPAALTLEASLMLTAQYNGALSKIIASGNLVSHRNQLLHLAPYGMALCLPPKTVITGRPNVGKSTLTNTLLGQKRVIESPIAGTTRDAVATFMNLDGVPIELVDTAGLGHADGELEMLAAEKTRSVLDQADLALCILDGSTEITDEDRDLLQICPGEKTVVVINKKDLPPHPSLAGIEAVTKKPRVLVSAREKTGLDELRAIMLTTLFPVIPEDISGPIPFTERQADLLRKLNESNRADIAEKLLRFNHDNALGPGRQT